jgi:antitoxin (DNA-binding transcriptional repressor) of toxin-antitoxin stability system
MAEVTIRELQKHGREVLDRVAAGERVTVTRNGRPVAETRRSRRPPETGTAPPRDLRSRMMAHVGLLESAP